MLVDVSCKCFYVSSPVAIGTILFIQTDDIDACIYRYMHISFTRLQDLFHTANDYLPHLTDSLTSTLHAILLPPSPIAVRLKCVNTMPDWFSHVNLPQLAAYCISRLTANHNCGQGGPRASSVYVCLLSISSSRLYATDPHLHLLRPFLVPTYYGSTREWHQQSMVVVVVVYGLFSFGHNEIQLVLSIRERKSRPFIIPCLGKID